MKEYPRLFKYKASDCESEDDVIQALAYYHSIESSVPTSQLNNYYEIIESFKKEFIKYDVAKEMEEVTEHDRIYLYHKAIRLSTEFLLNSPSPEQLGELYFTIKEGLSLTGVTWDDDIHFTDLVDFGHAYTKKDKVVHFIHKVLISGFHDRGTLISTMNLYIKLINVLQLSKKIAIPLPCKKSLHNVSFALPEFKY